MPGDSAPCCAHDHDCEAEDCSPAWSLHEHVDAAKFRALNAAAPAPNASELLRPWNKRTRTARPPLVSDDDDPPELLVHVPFDGLVKITAFSIVCAGDEDEGAPTSTSAAPPTRVRLFVNRDNLDFESVRSIEATQEFDVVVPGIRAGAAVEYPVKPSKFSGVYSVDVHLPGNPTTDSDDEVRPTRIDFLGFKGSHTAAKREAVVAVYEARPVPKDHKLPGEVGGGFADVS